MEEIQPPQNQEHRIEAAGVFPASENAATTSKRQRRPSVRLVEIGDQPAATLFQESNRRPKHWKPIGGKDQIGNGGKSSKIRQLDKLSGGSYQQEETLDLIEGESTRELNLDNLAIGSWRTKDSNKSKRVAKKPRTNWHPKFHDGGGGRNAEDDSKSVRGDDDDETDELSKEQLGLGGSQLRRSHHSSSRVRVEEETDFHGGDDDDDLDGPLETNQRNVGSQDGVKNWLERLGLRRYWPVFEIHEVDEEVLPLLTLDDLKDMGITAVGSRRKMFGAIQKLRKGFS